MQEQYDAWSRGPHHAVAVLDRIGDQLVENEPARNGQIEAQYPHPEVEPGADPVAAVVRNNEVGHQGDGVFAEINPLEILRLIEPLVDHGHGPDPLIAVLQHALDLGVGQPGGGQVEQADDDPE